MEEDCVRMDEGQSDRSLPASLSFSPLKPNLLLVADDRGALGVINTMAKCDNTKSELVHRWVSIIFNSNFKFYFFLERVSWLTR